MKPKLPILDSKELIEQAKQHKQEAQYHKWDWKTFENGYLTCYADMLIEANKSK
ncbi:MAG: hypothetical protein WC877_07885 [Dehalococcoidales bacterium]|jgi:hypothetical protein